MQHKSKARQAGIAIDAYMRFRAAQEGQAYDFTPNILKSSFIAASSASLVSPMRMAS